MSRSGNEQWWKAIEDAFQRGWNRALEEAEKHILEKSEDLRVCHCQKRALKQAAEIVAGYRGLVLDLDHRNNEKPA